MRIETERVHSVLWTQCTAAIPDAAEPRAMSSRYLFAGRDGKHSLLTMVFLMMLQHTMIAITGNSFRSSVRDWAAETASYPREVVEMALARTVVEKAKATYRGGNPLEKRRELTGASGIFISTKSTPSAIT